MNEKLPKYIADIDGELWFTEYDRGNMRLSYRVKRILAVEESKFQHVLMLDLADFGPTLVLDGCLQSSSVCGHVYNEMIVHIPMLSHPNPKRVLIIGGGDCGAAREALKYPNATIDMVEIDEAVIRLSIEHMPQVSGGPDFDSRLTFKIEDGFAHVERTKNEYDVIVVDSSDPDGPAASLFNEKFYQNIKAAMKPGGIMTCMSESPILYAGYLRSIRKTLGAIFNLVETYWFATLDYPGGIFSLTYASDSAPPLATGREFSKNTKYINDDILQTCFSLPPFVNEILQADSEFVRAEDFPGR